MKVINLKAKPTLSTQTYCTLRALKQKGAKNNIQKDIYRQNPDDVKPHLIDI